MGIKFNDTNEQVIEWSNTQSAYSSTSTIMFWVDLEAVSVAGHELNLFRLHNDNVSSNIGYAVQFIRSDSALYANRFRFFRGWSGSSGGAGIWNFQHSTGLQHIAITYDDNSAANDPIIYVNGVTQTLTESTAPSGTKVPIASTAFFSIGDPGSATTSKSFKGTISSFVIYNRIFTAAEVMNAYTSRKLIPSYNGLIFAPSLTAPAGGLADEATMAAGNTILDIATGSIGVPGGSPVFKANTLLTLGGE